MKPPHVGGLRCFGDLVIASARPSDDPGAHFRREPSHLACTEMPPAREHPARHMIIDRRSTEARFGDDDLDVPKFIIPKEPAHLALHPFGQIPTYEEDGLALFETGAIVFHIAERHAGLLPEGSNARARAIMWMFAALSTVEPPIVDRDVVKYAERDKSWRDERMAMVNDRIRVRLGELSARLGDADWLDGAFSAADILMVHVLRRLEGSGLLDEYPNLAAYIARAEARPAYRRAFAAQLAVFKGTV